jgi:rhodanese-related sulfurtransferase
MKNAAITILLSCISSTLPVSSAYLTIDDASKSASLWLDAYFQVLVDVRSPSEWALGHLPNATFIPIETTGLVFLRVKQWDFSRLDGCEDCHIAIYCHSGVRSKLAADYLEREGFRNVYDVLGIQQWTKVGVELVSDKEDQDPTCCYVSCQASVTSEIESVGNMLMFCWFHFLFSTVFLILSIA